MTDYGLPSSNIVETGSSILNTNPSAELDHGILIVKKEKWDTNKIYEKVQNIDEYKALFGEDEYVSQVSSYFAQQNKGGSSPQYLIVVNYFETATVAYVDGGVITSAFGDGFKLKENIFLNINGTISNPELDLSATTSFSSIATAITTLLGDNGSCVWNANKKRFEITGVSTGATSVITLEDDAGTIVSLLKLDEAHRALNIEGADAETFPAVFSKTYNANTFGYTFFVGDVMTLAIEDLIEVDNTINGFKIPMKFAYGVTESVDAIALSDEVIANNLKNIKILLNKGSENRAVLDASIGACQDPVNQAFTDYNYFYPIGYTTDTDKGSQAQISTGDTNTAFSNALIASKVGFIANIGNGGGVNAQLVYRDGAMAGQYQDETVHYVDRYIQKQEQYQIGQFLISQKIVGANDPEAKSQIISLLSGILLNASTYGLITTKTLSTEEQIFIRSIGGDKTTVMALQQVGFSIMSLVIAKNSANQWQANIKIAYIVNAGLKKMSIMNYIIN